MEKKNIFKGGIVSFFVAMGIVYYFQKSPDNDIVISSAPFEDVESKRKEHEKQKKIACDYLEDKINTIPERYFNRQEALNGAKILLECINLDVKDFSEKHKLVCENIASGLKRNSPKWKHPILYPFYSEIYEKICKLDIINGNELSYLRDLKNEIDKKLPVLDPKKSISEICKPALDTIRENKDSLKSVIGYLLISENKFKKGGLLEKMFTKSKINVEKKKKENPTKFSNLTIESYLHGNLENAVLQPITVWTTCKLPIDRMVEFFYKREVKEGETKEVASEEKKKEILEKRKEALPLLVEIVDLVLNDSTEDGKKILKVLSKLANEFTRIK
jgi:hypothetical protein